MNIQCLRLRSVGGIDKWALFRRVAMHGFITSNQFLGLSEMSGTIKEVARLAGVSTATVSRVANCSGNVSRETRTRVLNAISTLQYCANTAAVELSQARGDSPTRRTTRVSALADKRSKPSSVPSADSQKVQWQRRHLCYLKGECARVRRVVAKLSKDLEKLRSIVR